ncbi:MAG: DMT family transporter [Burkholderiaceae bacterium]|nr:DMT family transporter [Burkholderiaceae bacterium]
MLAFGASLAFASVLLLTTRWLSTIDGRVRSLLLMSTVAALTLLIGGLAGGFRAPHDTPGWLGLAILATLYASAMTALFTVLPRLGAVNNAAVLNVEPIAALGMGWLVLGQAVAPIQLVGAALVVGAIVMLSAGHTR